MRINVALGALAATQLVASLIAQLAVLRIVGVGHAADAFIAAQTLPQILSSIVVTSLQSLWLPKFVSATEPSADTPFGAEVAVAQGQTLSLLLALAGPLVLTAPLWTRLVFPGFDATQVGLVSAMSLPLLLGCAANGLSLLLTCSLRARGRFAIGEVVAVSSVVVGIGLIVALVPTYGVEAAAWILCARSVAAYAILWMICRRPTIALRPNATGRRIWRQLRGLLGGATLTKASPLVDRYWSSRAASGGLTSLNIAQLVVNAVATILERAILVPAVPQFARHLERRDAPATTLAYHRCLFQILLVTGASTALLVVLRPLWTAVLMIGLRLAEPAADQIWTACLLFMPFLFASVASSASVAVFYAFGETKVPVAIGVIGFLPSILIKGALFSHFGIAGIAAGASAYLFPTFLMYHYAARRRLARAAGETSVPFDPP